MRRFALLACLLLACVPARADPGMMLAGVANRQMPLDAVAIAPTACFSERRLRTAYTTNKGINIVRASDSTQTDIGFTPAGYPDKATETAFCAATTCKRVTVYDQCGSNNRTQATDANRYVRAAGPGVWNTGQATAVTQTEASASNITPATGLVSFGVVASRASGTGVCAYRENGNVNRLGGTSGVGGTWQLTGGSSGSFTAAAAGGSFHAFVAVMNAASSVFSVDNTETTGTATGAVTAGAPAIVGAASTTCNDNEMIILDNYALTAGERTYISNGMRIGWGF